MKFDLGEVVVTPAAFEALEAHGHCIDDVLARHQAGDWGDVTDQVRAVNERALAERFSVQSEYAVAEGQRLVVVTDRQRARTMIHLDGRTN